MSTRLVFRNTGLLVIAQIIGAPIAIVANAVAARKLGPGDFGLLYQAATFSAAAFLIAEWGTPNVMMAKIVARRSMAGQYLGSVLAFRLVGAIAAGLIVNAVCLALGFGHRFAVVLSLVMLSATFAGLVSACQDTLRAFERSELGAATYVAWQVSSVLVMVPVLLLGGGLTGLLIAQAGCSIAGCAFIIAMLPRLRVPVLELNTRLIRELVREGRPFLVFSGILLLQPLIDAAILSWLAPPPARDLGWFAAARKLVGVAVLPAASLVSALYPTLCRLRIESMDSYRKTVADALYAVAVVAVPMAIGCAIFADLGIAIFGLTDFGPAADDLRVLAAFVAMVYISMPIGSCLTSLGRQRSWTALQFGCVIVSAALDPPLIRWFIQHSNNGGLGVCVAADISELLMLSGALLLLPRGILAKLPWPKLAGIALSGAAMAAVAYGSSGLNIVLRALAATTTYLVCLQVSGGFSFLQAPALLREIRGQRDAGS